MRARIAVLAAMAEAAAASEPPTERRAAVCGRVRLLLDDAEAAAGEGGHGWRRWLADWRSGGSIERAWRNLHGAEILLAEVAELGELSSQRPAVRSLAERVLPANDARAVAIESRLADTEWVGAGDDGDEVRARRLRREYIAALTWVSDACDKNFTRVRSFRNIVLAASAGLAAVAIALGVIGTASPGSLPLCFDPGAASIEDTRVTGDDGRTLVCPTGVAEGSTGGDTPLVLAVGLASGALAAAVAVRGMRGTSTPYGVPVAIAWLKLPAGALTALFGMLMLQGAFIPGLSALDTQGQIIAYAIVFGYAQQALTRLVDNQAQVVLDRAPSSDPATAAPAPAPGDALALDAVA